MEWANTFEKQVAEYLPDLELVENEPMSRHTTFHIGGPARWMAFPKTGEQLIRLLDIAKEYGMETLVIGKGSNLLVPDEGLDRLVIDTSGINDVELLEGDRIRAGAGISLARLADFACKNSLTGLEFAHGIPGTLGGAVCMNAGAYGGEMCQVVEEVTALFPDGIRTMKPEDLDLSYRHSVFSDHPEAVVLGVTMKLTPGDPEAIRGQMQELMARRKASQPLEYPSAGSTFKRPVGYFAGTLIDQCGLKGLTVGGAQVSEKHAGFIINCGGATFADVTELIRQVQEIVLKEKGVRLEPEVRVIH